RVDGEVGAGGFECVCAPGDTLADEVVAESRFGDRESVEEACEGQEKTAREDGQDEDNGDHRGQPVGTQTGEENQEEDIAGDAGPVTCGIHAKGGGAPPSGHCETE